MIKLSSLVYALFLCPSFYATFYYQKSTSSAESSSEIIGYSPDFERLFPEFGHVSTSSESSPNSKGQTPEKPYLDSFKSSPKMSNYINEPTQVADGYTRVEPHADGFTRSESRSDGFKLAKPHYAGHSGSSHPDGSFQTLHHVVDTTRDDVLPFPLELSDFWTSQLKTTPASAPISHLQSSTPGGFRQAENVVYSSSSRGPGFHGAVYERSSVSDGYSHVEEDSDKYSSSYTLHDSNDTLSPHEPRPVSDGYTFEVKSDGYSSKVPVFDTSSSHESRPVADGYSVVESYQGTASRTSSVLGKKNTQSQLDDGYTLVKPKSDGYSSKVPVFDTSSSHESIPVADGYSVVESNQGTASRSSSLPGKKNTQSQLDDGYTLVKPKSDGYSSKVSVFDTSSSHESTPVADGYLVVESNEGSASRSSSVPGKKNTPSQLDNGYTLVKHRSDGYSSKVPVFDTSSSHESTPVADGDSVVESNQGTASRSSLVPGKKNTQSQLDNGYTLVKPRSDGYSSKVPVFDTSSSHESTPVADGDSVVESNQGTASRSSLVPGKKNTQSQLDDGYTLVKPKSDGQLSSSKVPYLDTSRSHHEQLTDGYRLVEAKSDGNRKVLDLDNSSFLESRLVADGYTLVESNAVELSNTSTVNHFKDSRSQHVEINSDSAFTSKTTTFKPVSAGFFSKFNNGGNFAVQRPRKTQDLKSTSTHSDLNTDANRRILTTHTGDESNSVETNKDLSTIKNNDDKDQDGVLAYLVSDEGNPGSDFLLTKSALIQSGLVFNKVVSMSANTVDAGGKVEILDNRSFQLTGLRYAGPGPARWIAGTTFPAGLYSDTVVLASWIPGAEEEHLTLPGQVTVADISWLALYCRTCSQGRVVMQVYVPETFL